MAARVFSTNAGNIEIRWRERMHNFSISARSRLSKTPHQMMMMTIGPVQWCNEKRSWFRRDFVIAKI